MKSYIITKKEKCVGCNKCIFYCPVIDTNISHLDKNHRSKTRVRQDKCIMCGRCLEVCDHQARDYSDDTERFLQALKDGEQISLLVAPSIKNNIPNYRKLFGYLRSLGAVNFYDVSFGADITTWAYLEIMEQKNLENMIAQPCPAIVSYIQYYCHSLLEDLAPIQSPLMCTAIYLKKYLQVPEQLSFLSPCVAKIAEINDPNTLGLVRHNITFRKLLAYLDEHHVDLNSYPEVDFTSPPRDIPQDLPSVYCDRDRIIQVIINLLSNAVKFTPKGTITCRVTANAEELTVSVIDEGIGIAEENLRDIFEKFKQVEDTLTDKPQERVSACQSVSRSSNTTEGGFG